MSQAIFYVKTSVMLEILAAVKVKYSSNDLAWGEGDRYDSVLAKIQALDNGGYIRCSVLANYLRSIVTIKMVGNANAALDLLILRMNQAKIPDSLIKVQEHHPSVVYDPQAMAKAMRDVGDGYNLHIDGTVVPSMIDAKHAYTTFNQPYFGSAEGHAATIQGPTAEYVARAMLSHLCGVGNVGDELHMLPTESKDRLIWTIMDIIELAYPEGTQPSEFLKQIMKQEIVS